MSLDADVPEPPELEHDFDADDYDDVEVVGQGDYRREELEGLLRDGAWQRAFDEWADGTDMDEDDFRVADEMDLFAEFDFFWDDFADRVGYHAPGIPEDWKQRDLHPGLDSWEVVSTINAELTSLGQIVCDVLEDQYIDWEADYDAPDDLPDF